MSTISNNKKENLVEFSDLDFPLEQLRFIEQYCSPRKVTASDVLGIMKGLEKRQTYQNIAKTVNFTESQLKYFCNQLGKSNNNPISEKRSKFFISETYRPEDDTISWQYFIDHQLLDEKQLAYAMKYCEQRGFTPNHMRIFIEGLRLGIPLVNLRKQTGLTVTQGKVLLKRLQPINNREKSFNHLSNSEKEQKLITIANDVLQLRSIHDIERRNNIDLRKINPSIYEQFGIIDGGYFAKNVNFHLRENRNIPLSPLLKEISIGTNLGDSYTRNHIEKNIDKDPVDPGVYQTSHDSLLNIKEQLNQQPLKNKHDIDHIVPRFNKAYKALMHVPMATFNIHMGMKAKPWLETLESIYSNEGMPCKIAPWKYTDKNGKIVQSLNLRLLTSIQYFAEWRKWYQQGNKIVPRDIELTPTTCLVWLMDDGCSTSKRITFNTQSFTKFEVDFLIKKLKQLGFYARRVKEGNYGVPDQKIYDERYWLITLGRKENVENFFQYCKQANPRLVKTVEQHYSHKFEV